MGGGGPEETGDGKKGKGVVESLWEVNFGWKEGIKNQGERRGGKGYSKKNREMPNKGLGKEGNWGRNDKEKRMELWRAGGSGPFWCFLKHRGKNAAIFGSRPEILSDSQCLQTQQRKRLRKSVCMYQNRDMSRNILSPVWRLHKQLKQVWTAASSGNHENNKRTNNLFRNIQK